MLGAILGDIIGSVHEGAGTKTKQFPLFVSRSYFTDDSVLTVAVAEWLLTGEELIALLQAYYHAYPGRGYGGMFDRWASRRRREPYNSFGNGSAMRVSPVGFAFGTIEEVLTWAERSAAATHNHAEGIRGAQATAAAIYYARRIEDRDEIRRLLESRFGYDLGTPLDEIRPTYGFDVTCQGTVPQALRAFLESTGYEDAIRNAISLGGDADTLACITGGVAEAYYGVPDDLAARARELLDARMVGILDRFREHYGPWAVGGGTRPSRRAAAAAKSDLERPLLILDLDETLIWASPTKPERPFGFRVGPYYITKRPYLSEFLESAFLWFDVAVWTSSTEAYAAVVVEHLFGGRTGLKFVWTSERCTQRYDHETREYYSLKDLKKVRRAGYPLERVLVLDDSPEKLSRHHGNHLRVRPFEGDPEDGELRAVLPFLDWIRTQENFRRIDKRRWKEREAPR